MAVRTFPGLPWAGLAEKECPLPDDVQPLTSAQRKNAKPSAAFGWREGTDAHAPSAPAQPPAAAVSGVSGRSGSSNRVRARLARLGV